MKPSDPADETRTVPENRDSESRKQLPFQIYGVVMVRVTEMVVLILAGYFGGNWLDTRFDVSPLCLAGGIILGFVGGLVRMVFTVNRYMEK
jgi:F0F1-type ATP synthase assembly protein I